MRNWDSRRKAALETLAIEVLGDPDASAADKAEAEAELLYPVTDDTYECLSDEEIDVYIRACEIHRKLKAEARK